MLLEIAFAVSAILGALKSCIRRFVYQYECLNFQKNLADATCPAEFVNFEVIHDSKSMSMETFDNESTNLLLSSDDIMDIQSPKRMKKS